MKLLASCGKRVEEGVPLGVEIFLPFLREAAQRRDGIPITIVLEVERGKSSPEVLVTIKGIAKQLALAANVIVILSEANAGLAFGDDKRQQFIWVDEMTNGEATEYARKFETNVSDTDLEILFENIGMLPLDISYFMDDLTEGKSVDEIVERAVLSAEADLVGFIHKQILHELKGSPDGVNVKAFDRVMNEGVHLGTVNQVAVAMKDVNAIAYHLPSQEYRLANRAHRTALKRYNL